MSQSNILLGWFSFLLLNTVVASRVPVANHPLSSPPPRHENRLYPPSPEPLAIVSPPARRRHSPALSPAAAETPTDLLNPSPLTEGFPPPQALAAGTPSSSPNLEGPELSPALSPAAAETPSDSPDSAPLTEGFPPAQAPAAGTPSGSSDLEGGAPPALTPVDSAQAYAPAPANSSETGGVSGSAPESGNTEGLTEAVEFNVLDYGALGDGSNNDSQAFADAWTAACVVVDGYVHAPAGYEFKVYPLSFKGPCEANFTFKVDGTILAPEDPSVYSGRVWLGFKRVTMTLQGSGTINGQGQQWWANSCKTNASNPCVDGPTAVVFDTCTNVTVKNVAILNSQQMHLSFAKSSGVLVDNVTITAPGTSPNTDGIHISNSSNVAIKNTMIGTGDDCISIQSGSFSVEIKDVTCGPGHGISVGGLGKHNATAELADLVVDTVVFKGATNGVRIKSWQGSSGYATSFSFKNIQMIDTTNPILIDQYYCDSSSSGSCANYTSNVVISDISYKNITGTTANKAAVKFQCSETVPCTGISLDDIDLVQTSGKAATAICTDAWGTAANTVIPDSCLQT